MRTLARVGAGGLLGGLARHGLLALAGPGAHALALLAVNVVGSGLLGLLVGAATGRRGWVRPFAGTGVLGGFTTYSAAMAATVELSGSGLVAPAGYLLASLLASVLAAAAGHLAGERVRRRRRLEGAA